MCIIVAKNSGIKMPSKDIISTCFINNPDGAGIMLASKGRVYGFKGLMTFDAFQAKLKQLEKRFGPLKDIPVVMHFRIGTHGANIAANTHPFPVSDSYKRLRKLEWTSELGMAHNGIIQATGHHPDVKKENVSDTMVFIRRIVAPISAKTDIMQNPAILDGLQIAADSKLCFLDAKGNLACLGDFQVSDGVYYSNSTFKEARFRSAWASYLYDWDDYDFQKSTKKSKTPSYFKISASDERYLMEDIAFDYGLTILGDDWVIKGDNFIIGSDGLDYAIDESDGMLYYWDNDQYDWLESSFNGQIVEIVPKEEDADA